MKENIMSGKFLPLLAGAAAVLAVPASAGPRLSHEAQLQRALEGRVAGEPVDCVSLRTARNSRIINGTAIVFDAGSTIYVNRPRSGAESLNDWDTQVTHPLSDRLCSIDTVKMVDPVTGHLSGVVFLGDFVPYRRARN
jgi:hypothetical protein